jgi:hypothetical protein
MTAPPPARHADFRFARVTALHRLGPRALAELLAEFGCEHLIRSAIETKLRRYIERLTPGLLRASVATASRPARYESSRLGDSDATEGRRAAESLGF